MSIASPTRLDTAKSGPAGNAAVRSQPQFADSDFEHGRGAQGGRKKSWLSNIAD